MHEQPSWSTCILAEHLAEKPRNGYSPKEVDFWTGTLALGLGCLSLTGFSSSHLKNVPAGDRRNDAAILREGDLLISRANTRELVGLVGRYKDVGRPCIYPDLMMRLTPAPTLRPDFLEILLRSRSVRHQIQAMSQGTSESMVKISGAVVMQLKISIPDLTEQQRIVEIQDALNAQIDLVGNFIGKRIKLHSGLLGEAFSPLKSGATLEEVLSGTPKNGIYKHASEYVEDGVRIVRIDRIQRGEILSVETMPRVSMRHTERNEFNLGVGDILVNRVNSIDHVGKSALVRQVPESMTYESNMMRCRIRSDRANPAFVALWLGTHSAMQYFRICAKSAIAQASINQKDVRGCPIPLPDLATQDEIVSRFTESDRILSLQRDELSKLRLLKQGLMDDLLTGRVRVKDVENAL
ncbi:restriction endonuclease subunit S [Streptosporangium amethystogenes]|uniref:restriction endonuclease subunit S n=1 Tax=Streptosporangium amethystogenes TaxID=2002 RepID=UPI0037A8444C